MSEEEMMIQDINENCYELYSEEYVEQLQQENTQLKQQLKDKDEKISKAIEYIKDNTRYYDKEYSGIYGELCDCAGLGDTRLHVVVGDDELLKILESNKED